MSNCNCLKQDQYANCCRAERHLMEKIKNSEEIVQLKEKFEKSEKRFNI